MTRRPPSYGAMCILHCALLLLLAACVTEHRRPAPAINRPIPRTETHHAAEPLATPVPDAATVRSHVRLAVLPLGQIEYDGQVLPLTSPDGAHIAAAIGAAPSWPALLGEPGASPPAGARIVIYDIDDTRLRRAHELPHAALMLGRSTNDRGFLVESPRPDGSRWIGFAHWDNASLDWLIRDEHVNAHAALAPNGTLAFTRRDDATSPAELVLLFSRDATERERSHDSLTRPSFNSPSNNSAVTRQLTWRPPTHSTQLIAPAFDAHGQLYAFVIHHDDTPESDRGVELLRFTLAESGLEVDARVYLSPSTNPLWVHQALAPMNGWHGWHDSPSRDPITQSSFTFFHPDRRNIVTWAADSQPAPGATRPPTGSPTPVGLIDWAEGSVAWAPAGPAAAFLTTSDGLIYQPDPSHTRTEPDQTVARALSVPGIPRATRDSAQFLLLAPPSKGHARALDLFQIGIPSAPTDEQEPPVVEP